MPITLPYLSAPGTIDSAFARMKEAATPARFTNDFVNTVLNIKGGTGAAVPPFLKKIGFLNPDGSPTSLYDRFRNGTTSGAAVAEATRIGYRALFQANEYAHKLGDAELRGLILQLTGLEKDNRIAQLMFLTFKKLRGHADFESAGTSVEEPFRDGQPAPVGQPAHAVPGGQASTAAVISGGRGVHGLQLSYTIHLNLPTTTNIEVFNAIFRSLKEHLLNG